MSTEDNKANVRRGLEAMNERDWAAWDALCAPDIVYHYGSQTMQGYPAYKQWFSMIDTAFPESGATIDDMIAEGDRVVVRQTYRGTHTGDLMGIAPTGKQVTTTWISIFRLVNGKIVEQWGESDLLGMMQQLGAVPAMG